MKEKALTHVLYTDLVHSTEAPKHTRDRHISVVIEAIQEYKAYFNDIETSNPEISGDGIKTEFKDPWYAIEAAMCIQDRTRRLDDSLFDRIGLDTGPGKSTDPNFDEYQTFARASRIKDHCPKGHILCSKELLNCLEETQVKALGVSGPFIVKLRSFARPVSLFIIGTDALDMTINSWQTAKSQPRFGGPLGYLKKGGVATLLSDPLFRLFRDTGKYSLGKFWFYFLFKMSKLLNWTWLELQSSIGLSDVSMRLEEFEDALRWHENVDQIAEALGDKYFHAMSIYQFAHNLAHKEPTVEAENLFRKAYSLFEEEADSRMGGWSALYLGRCLRGLGSNEEAEDWILASIAIFASAKNLNRQIAYALTQMARLRAVQKKYHFSKLYLDQANTLHPDAVTRAPDDAPWEEPLNSIKKRISNKTSVPYQEAIDPAQELILAALIPTYLRNK